MNGPACRMRNLPQGARVLLVAEARSPGIERDVVVEDPFHERLLLELGDRVSSPAELAALLRERGITHLLYNREEARRMARSAGREAYFATGRERGRRVVRGFFRACLDPLARVGPSPIYRLRGRCRPGDPGPFSAPVSGRTRDHAAW